MSLQQSTGTYRRLLWPLLLAVTIFSASGWNVAPAAPSMDWIDIHVWAHFAVFGLLATLILRCFGTAYSSHRALVAAFAFAAAMGLGDELRQYFNPVRHASLLDLAVDCLGAATAIAAYRFWPAYRRVLEWDLVTLWRPLLPPGGGARRRVTAAGMRSSSAKG